MKNRYVGELDYLRFFAAAFVVIYHFGQFSYLQPSAGERGGALQAYPFLPDWSSFGWVGVQFFFVLSGYVISRSVEGKVASEFAFHRAIRIVPALWIMMTFALLVRIVFGESIAQLIVYWLKTIFLSPAGPYVDGVVWTLVVEVVFYSLFFIGLLLFPRVKSTKLASRIGLGLTLWGTLFTIAHMSSLSFGDHRFSAVFDRFYWVPVLGVHAIYFSLGILLSLVSTRGCRGRDVLHALILLGLVIVQIKIQAKGEPAGFLLPFAVWLGLTGYMAFAVLSRSEMPKIFPPALGKTLGRLSYTLYLGHYTIGMYTTVVLANFLQHRAGILGFAAQMFGIVLLALIVAQFIERPVQRSLSRWWNSKMSSHFKKQSLAQP